MKLKIKIGICIIVNLFLFIALYNIPIESEILKNICLFKNITGKDCWNCGMTRAFLSMLHFNFEEAYKYNPRVIVIFPLTIGIYVYSWYRYIFAERGDKNE